MRHVTLITICIALGALITVMVSTACAIWLVAHSADMISNGRTTNDDTGWVVRCYKRPGLLYVIGSPIIDVREIPGWQDGLSKHVDLALLRGIDAFDEILVPEPDYQRTRVIVARGWPLPALWMQAAEANNRLNIYAGRDPIFSGGLVFERESNVSAVEYYSDQLLIPWRPVWRGFLIDTLCYAILMGGIVHARRCVRRRIRFISRAHVAPIVLVSVILGLLTCLAAIAICTAYVDEQYQDFGPGDYFGENLNGPNYAVWWLRIEQDLGAMRVRSEWLPPGSGWGRVGGAPDGLVYPYLPHWAAAYLTPTNETQLVRHADARGWPMLAAWGGFEETRAIQDGRYVGRLGKTHQAIVLPRYYEGEFHADMSRVIPLMPIFSGLAGNTLFFAALWLLMMLLFLGAGIIRRSIRYSRGCCISCGYDLRGTRTDRCSECGQSRA